MNGNKMTRILAVLVCAFMLIQCAAVSVIAEDIAPEAVVFTRPEVTSAVANQIGMNYVYVDVVTDGGNTDQTVMIYMLDKNGDLVTVGYASLSGDKAYGVKLGASDDVPTGDYKLIVALHKAADVFESEVFYVGTEDVKGFFEAINMTEGDVKTKLDAHYNALSVIEFAKDEDGNVILKLTGEDYEALSDDAGKAAFAELILNGVNGKYSENKGNYDAKNSEEFVKEAYIVAAYNSEDKVDKSFADLIYRFESVIGFDAEDEDLYARVQEKTTLMQVVKTIAPTVKNVEELAAALEKAAAVQIVNEASWLNLVNVIKNSNDIFNVDEDEIEELEDSKKFRKLFCEEFKGTYYSVEEIQEAWDDAYKAAEKAYNASQSSSDGPSRGPSGVPTTIKTAEINTQISQDENQKDPNVEIKDYYTDVADNANYNWASDAILNLTKNQIVTGYGDKTFGPEKSVTRAEFMKMVVNVFGLADITAVSSFADVDPNAWYYIYVASAEKLGIAQGYGNGLFGINDPVTRQDAITIVYRAAKGKGLSIEKFAAGIDKFVDKGEIAPYALEAVSALHNTGVYLDAGDKMSVNVFEPTKNASRAYLAVILDQIYRFVK